MDGEEDFGSAGEVLDVAVSTMFRTSWDRASAFFRDFVLHGTCGGAGVGVLGLWWLCNDAVQVRVRRDEFGFTRVPGFEDFGGGGTA